MRGCRQLCNWEILKLHREETTKRWGIQQILCISLWQPFILSFFQFCNFPQILCCVSVSQINKSDQIPFPFCSQLIELSILSDLDHLPSATTSINNKLSKIQISTLLYSRFSQFYSRNNILYSTSSFYIEGNERLPTYYSWEQREASIFLLISLSIHLRLLSMTNKFSWENSPVLQQENRAVEELGWQRPPGRRSPEAVRGQRQQRSLITLQSDGVTLTFMVKCLTTPHSQLQYSAVITHLQCSY